MVDTAFKVRPANRGDIEALVEIESSCFGDGPYKKHQFNRAQYYYYLRNPQAVIIVGEIGGEIVASVIATVGTGNRSKKGNILSIAVLNNLRRKGFGHKILCEALQILRVRGCEYTDLDVSEHAMAATNLFHSLGFKQTAHFPNYYGLSNDGLRMRHDMLTSEN